jgi:hypothetical protein
MNDLLLETPLDTMGAREFKVTFDFQATTLCAYHQLVAPYPPELS